MADWEPPTGQLSPPSTGGGSPPLQPGAGGISAGGAGGTAGRRRPARSFALTPALSALRETLPPTFPAWRPRETHRGRVLLLACLLCGARCLPSLVLGASTFSRPRFGRLAVAIFGHTRTRPSQYINVYLLAHPRLEAGVTTTLRTGWDRGTWTQPSCNRGSGRAATRRALWTAGAAGGGVVQGYVDAMNVGAPGGARPLLPPTIRARGNGRSGGSRKRLPQPAQLSHGSAGARRLAGPLQEEQRQRRRRQKTG